MTKPGPGPDTAAHEGRQERARQTRGTGGAGDGGSSARASQAHLQGAPGLAVGTRILEPRDLWRFTTRGASGALKARRSGGAELCPHSSAPHLPPGTPARGRPTSLGISVPRAMQDTHTTGSSRLSPAPTNGIGCSRIQS